MIISNPVNIEKIITLSTRHIRPETAKSLDYELNNDAMFIVVYAKEDFGWFIKVPEDFNEIDVPYDLMQCLLFARDLGCSWLCLDRDGQELYYLPRYFW